MHHSESDVRRYGAEVEERVLVRFDTHYRLHTARYRVDVDVFLKHRRDTTVTSHNFDNVSTYEH